MDDGVRVEVDVTDESVCRVVDESRQLSPITSVTRSATPGRDAVTVEFTTDTAADVGGANEVFSYDDRTVYRFTEAAESTSDCACTVVEDEGCPVHHLEAEEGVLTVAFFAPDLDAVRRIVSELQESFGGVSLRQLTRSDRSDDGGDPVFVDRAELTARQREVLDTAHRMGYFDHPKDANATDVSEALGINRSTFAEHLSAAQSKLLDSVLER
ncbi:helix-turn-helix domain-containing protein [Candidatus Halobonum tyrrellensis]|nr:helix-turn-helix domain-containing protein [Candidatus Halobonum tyrrellensis]